MRNLVLLSILLVIFLFTAGCIGNFVNSQESLDKNNVSEITQLKQINTSLQKSPVFVEIGAKWCPECRALQPIINNLSASYAEKATIASIDADKSKNLVDYFGVKYIPDSFVVVGIDKGKYVFMKENGNVTVNRDEARFIGLNESNETVFKKVLDLALSKNRLNLTLSQDSVDTNDVSEITQLEQINMSLEKSPVFIEIGAKWCPNCLALQPTIKKLAVSYAGKATIASIDADKSENFVDYFGVKYIPDSFVVVGIDKGKYVFMKENGNVTVNRDEARFIGLNESNETAFEKVLNLALSAKEKQIHIT